MDRIITVQSLVFVRSHSEVETASEVAARNYQFLRGPDRHLDKSKALDDRSNNTYTVVCRTKPAHAAAVSWCEACLEDSTYT
jgi:hypothetical protein